MVAPHIVICVINNAVAVAIGARERSHNLTDCVAPHVVICLIDGAVVVVIAEEEIQTEAVVFDFADGGWAVERQALLAPTEAGSQRGFHRIRGNRDLQIPSSGIEIRFSAEIVAVQRPGEAFAFVEVSVGIEIHPAGEQAAHAGDGHTQRVDALFQNPAIADDDHAVVAVAYLAFARGICRRNTIHFAVDACRPTESRELRSGEGHLRQRWCRSYLAGRPSRCRRDCLSQSSAT